MGYRKLIVSSFLALLLMSLYEPQEQEGGEAGKDGEFDEVRQLADKVVERFLGHRFAGEKLGDRAEDGVQKTEHRGAHLARSFPVEQGIAENEAKGKDNGEKDQDQ